MSSIYFNTGELIAPKRTVMGVRGYIVVEQQDSDVGHNLEIAHRLTGSAAAGGFPKDV